MSNDKNKTVIRKTAYEPTAEELAKATAEIRESWTESETIRRMAGSEIIYKDEETARLGLNGVRERKSPGNSK